MQRSPPHEAAVSSVAGGARERLEGEQRILPLDQVADDEHDRSGARELEATSRLGAIARVEQLAVDAVRHQMPAPRGPAETVEARHEIMGERAPVSGAAQRATQVLAESRALRHLHHVAAAAVDQKGDPARVQLLRRHRRGPRVVRNHRVGSGDPVEQRAQPDAREGAGVAPRDRHPRAPELREVEVAGTTDLDPAPPFLARHRRDPRPSPAREGARRARQRLHHRHLVAARRHGAPASFREDPLERLGRAGIEGGEDGDSHATRPRTS